MSISWGLYDESLKAAFHLIVPEFAIFSGLDPAGPLFAGQSNKAHLSRQDAGTVHNIG